MNKSEISKIFKEKLGYKALTIKDSSKGVDQEVKIVDTDNGKFIIKIPHKEQDKIFKEVIATEKCSKLNIPVPKVIYYDKNVLIETFIEGEILDEVLLKKREHEQIYRDLGKILNKMHSIKSKGFGTINSKNLKGKYTTQKQSIESYIIKELEHLKNSKFYSSKELNKILNYYNRNSKYLNIKKSVMLHNDLEPGNIIIKNKKISAIIDFGDLCAGSPMQDIARIYAKNNDYRLKEFLKAYGQHDLDEIKFHTFCFLTWRINGFVYGKDTKNKSFKKIIKVYKEIVS